MFFFTKQNQRQFSCIGIPYLNVTRRSPEFTEAPFVTATVSTVASLGAAISFSHLHCFQYEQSVACLNSLSRAYLYVQDGSRHRSSEISGSACRRSCRCRCCRGRGRSRCCCRSCRRSRSCRCRCCRGRGRGRSRSASPLLLLQPRMLYR